MDGTTIKIRVETRERLAKCGKKGETYDDIINELLRDSHRSEAHANKS